MFALFAQCLPPLHTIEHLQNVFGECFGAGIDLDDDEEQEEEEKTPAAPSSLLPQSLPPPTLPPSDPVRSDWVTRMGAAIPAAFWSSDAYSRLLWAANPKRNPVCRNSQSINKEGPTINNLLVSTPEGTFYMGWSNAYDGFRYFGDSSNVRRVYLELAAVKYARMFPMVLPDSKVQLPDPNMTATKQFIANEAGLVSLQKDMLNNSITDDLLQKGRERREKAAAAAALLMEKTGAHGVVEAIERRKRAARLRAEADPARLVVDDMIVAHNWCPELRALWLDRSLGSLSFQYGGKLATIFTTPKNSRYGGWSKSDVIKRIGQRGRQMNASTSTAGTTSLSHQPITCVNPNAAADNRKQHQSSSVGVMYQSDPTGGVSYVGGKYRVDLRNVTGLTMREFLAEKAKRIEAFVAKEEADDTTTAGTENDKAVDREGAVDVDGAVDNEEKIAVSRQFVFRRVNAGSLVLDVCVSVTATWKPLVSTTTPETREMMREVCANVASKVAGTGAMIKELRSHVEVAGPNSEYFSVKTLQVPSENGGWVQALVTAQFTLSGPN